MARIGIVGHEAAKFTEESKWRAIRVITNLLHPGDVVISGACHLGGIDIWAAEVGRAMGLEVIEHKPEKLTWRPRDGSKGFEARNIDIAKDSDKVYSIVVDKLPADYKGMRFDLCYHCGTTTHVKSGGCWTAWYATKKLGKPSQILIIPQVVAVHEGQVLHRV